MSEHRAAAEQALAGGQRNPVMSADQQFAIAQVHVLLAIEERLGELCDLSRLHALAHTTPDSLVPSGSVRVSSGRHGRIDVSTEEHR